MPKPKGSPKTGGRKPIGKEGRVNFQARLKPEEAKQVKEFIKIIRRELVDKD